MKGRKNAILHNCGAFDRLFVQLDAKTFSACRRHYELSAPNTRALPQRNASSAPRARSTCICGSLQNGADLKKSPAHAANGMRTCHALAREPLMRRGATATRGLTRCCGCARARCLRTGTRAAEPAIFPISVCEILAAPVCVLRRRSLQVVGLCCSRHSSKRRHSRHCDHCDHCDHKLTLCFLPLSFLVAQPSWVALILHKNNIPERCLNQPENNRISPLIIWWLQMSHHVLSFAEFQRIRPARKRAPFGSNQEPRTCMADGLSRSGPLKHGTPFITARRNRSNPAQSTASDLAPIAEFVVRRQTVPRRQIELSRSR
jgi:hypothetical protein